MRILQTPGELLPKPRLVCLAIGFFDGVHLGHQQVIRQAIADARQHEAQAIVVTFDRHPNAVVAPDRVPPLIHPLPLRLRALEQLGVQTTLLLHFDEALSRLSAEAFIRLLLEAWPRLASICVGAQFKFGFQRGGNVALLKRLGQEWRFAVRGLAAVALDGEPVSSTRIRESIRQGNLDAAGQMLGRPYTLCGQVIPGDRLGQKLGFPTANLDTTSLVLPPSGVYAVHVQTQGASHHAVLNIGHRPTLRQPQPQLRVEAHLLDFQGDLYGAPIEILFLKKLREEIAFESLDALRGQIQQDILDARECFRQDTD